MTSPNKILAIANKFVDKCGIGLPVHNVDNRQERIAMLDKKNNRILVYSTNVYAAYENCKLSIEDYIQIIISRELGRYLDPDYEYRSEKINRGYEFVIKGIESDTIKEYMESLKKEEETVAGEIGRQFIREDLYESYDSINERYVILAKEKTGRYVTSTRIKLQISEIKRMLTES
ncbi:hypothetical protein [Peribacillus loiseleuriae]|uniref:hypothetical protein n=1 Tax=Peribacillus loiseleuriae TaxID=1679170 RepID=UPI003D090407